MSRGQSSSYDASSLLSPTNLQESIALLRNIYVQDMTPDSSHTCRGQGKQKGGEENVHCVSLDLTDVSGEIVSQIPWDGMRDTCRGTPRRAITYRDQAPSRSIVSEVRYAEQFP